MKTLTLPRLYAEDEMLERFGGIQLGEDSYTHLIQEDADVFCADTGDLVARFRKGVINPDVAKSAWRNLREAAQKSFNRGIAAGRMSDATEGERGDGMMLGGSSVRFHPVKQDGTLTKTNYAKPVDSGIVGYYDRNPRMPYCRTTAYAMNHPDRFREAIPYFQAVSEQFKIHIPERYENQLAMIERTHPDFRIHGTVFTTVTVNKNWQTAVHTDRGDLKEGFGVLSAFRAGKRFDGCYFCFPAYGVAIDIDNCDILFGDVHRWHGNTPFRGIRGMYERISCVFYYRENMIHCESAEEELERAKNRQRGDAING